MTHVDISPASEQLRDLLNRVELGETVALADQGRPVARIIPIPTRTSIDRDNIAHAAREMLAYRAEQRRTLGDLTVREMIDEGRRF